MACSFVRSWFFSDAKKSHEARASWLIQYQLDLYPAAEFQRAKNGVISTTVGLKNTAEYVYNNPGQAIPKTVDRTLTTNSMGIMTTEIFRYYAENVFKENEVFQLRTNGSISQTDVAAIGWLIKTTNKNEAHEICAKTSIFEILEKTNLHELWLLTCHSAWQNDNAVSRKYKLWNSFRRRSIQLPDERHLLDEQTLEDQRGIKYFSAAEFHINEIPKMLNIIKEERNSYIALMPIGSISSISAIVRSTWQSNSTGPSSDVLTSVLTAGGLVLWPLGYFDDPESGVAIFGSTKNISELNRKLENSDESD